MGNGYAILLINCLLIVLLWGGCGLIDKYAMNKIEDLEKDCIAKMEEEESRYFSLVKFCTCFVTEEKSKEECLKEAEID